MHKGIFILFIVTGIGWNFSSCNSGETESVETVKGEAEEVENPNIEPEDTVKEEGQIRWYEGEEPTDLEKLQLLSSFNSGERKFDFYAVFTEPFWSFYFFGNEVLFNAADFEAPEVLTLEYPFSDKENEQALSFMRNGEFWQLKVTKEPGSDGMSDMEYPYSVKLDLMEGGGGTTFVKEE